MTGERAELIEAAIDGAAAALLAAAAGYGAAQMGSAAWGAAAAATGFAGGFTALRAVRPAAQTFALPRFEVAVEPAPDELVLTHADRCEPQAAELVLDDILAEPGPDARVVRLFDPRSMSTAEEIRPNLGRRLSERPSPGAPPDDSQALHDALAELRRSLS